jgi:L-rhamnose-H+ transport protein
MLIGALLAALSGVLTGAAFLPMRYMKKFAWENTWFVWALAGCFIMPPLIACVTIPSLLVVLREVGLRLNLIVLGVGLVAGTSGILFGRSLGKVGMTLANSLSNGVSLVIGSFVPLVIQHRGVLHSSVGASILAGLGLSVLGVVVCAVAGSQRGQESAYMQIDYHGGTRITAVALEGIALSIAAGLLTPFMNFGVAFADDYMKVARAHGASEAFMTLAFYVPYLGASFVSNAIYCGYLWKKNHTAKQFREPNGVRFTLMAVVMAGIWIVGMLLYGWAMPWMHTFGPVIGWPIMLASCNLGVAVIEYFYGDWTGKSLRTLTYGLIALSGSISLLAYSNWVLTKS